MIKGMIKGIKNKTYCFIKKRIVSVTALRMYPGLIAEYNEIHLRRAYTDYILYIISPQATLTRIAHLVVQFT